MSFHPPHEESPLASPPLAHAAAILVVDEDPAFQLGLKTFLREYVGFEKVFTARSGQEALDFVRAEPSIEVVTLDERMPGMSGLEVIDALRALATHPLAVLMITGHGSEELEKEFHARGSDLLLTTHFLTKPVRFEKLEPVILAAHEEVLAAQRRRNEVQKQSAEPESASPAEARSFAELAQRIDAQSEQIAGLEREVTAQRKKWRSDFWKLAFVVLLFWLAGQFGLLQRLEPHWTKAKETITEQVQSWIAKPATTAPEAASPEPAPAPLPPEERGEPL